MRQINRAGYAAAHRLIAAGLWSVDPTNGIIIGQAGKPIGGVGSAGYIQLMVWEHGKNRGWVKAHRLIWEHVHGRIPDGMEINHCNGIKTDARLANLEQVTPSGNQKHAFRIGLKSLAGSRNNNAKLTDRDVREIRQALADGETGRALARRFGVQPTAISKIRLGKRWQHVQMDG